MRPTLPFAFTALLAIALAPAQRPGPDDSREECSVGVATGRATADGRPLMWKNRDAPHRNNILHLFRDGRVPYIGICNYDDLTTVWGGVNAAGFCIMNSQSSDMPGDEEAGPGNGETMKTALQTCATVDDFEEMLRQTNRTVRGTQANFGVIDAVGGAAIFETGGEDYVRFDADDTTEGILVRTNFATTAGGKGGRQRFARANELCFERPADHRLDTRYILQQFCRDLAPPPSAQDGERGTQDVRETIHRQTTVAAMVFHGVQPGEDARWATMWAVLGQPLFSIAIPCWPAAGAVAAEVDGSPRSELCSASISLRSGFYGEPDEPDDDSERDICWLHTEGLSELQDELLPVETRILDATRRELDAWRAAAGDDGPDTATMLRFHREQVALALASIRALAAEFEAVGAQR